MTGEGFREGQSRPWVEALLEAMRAEFLTDAAGDHEQPGPVHRQDQFIASPTYKDAVVLAMIDTAQAHGRMMHLFQTKGAVEEACSRTSAGCFTWT